MASLQDILQEEQFSDCHPLSGCTFGVCLCSSCLRKAGLGGAGMGCEAVTPSLRLPKGIAFLAPDFVKGGMVLGWVGGWLLLAQLTKASAAATRWACTMRIRCEPQPVCRHRLGAIVEQFPLGRSLQLVIWLMWWLSPDFFVVGCIPAWNKQPYQPWFGSVRTGQTEQLTSSAKVRLPHLFKSLQPDAQACQVGCS